MNEVFPELRKKAALHKKRRKLQHQRNHVWEAYEKEIKAAKTRDEKQMLESGQHHECDEFDDELLSMDSIEIGNRASRCHLSLHDLPLREGETSHWETGNYGARFIHPQTLREFTKIVEAAEYERAKRNAELKDFC